jgi:hypothetical protein
MSNTLFVTYGWVQHYAGRIKVANSVYSHFACTAAGLAKLGERTELRPRRETFKLVD